VKRDPQIGWASPLVREGVAHGLKWCVRENDELGFLLGYVAVQFGHWGYEQSYSVMDVEVHGGLTFSRGDGTDWWFGFDAGHFNDAPNPSHTSAASPAYEGSTYRDADYMQSECESLALQLSEEPQS
jgi:hypothetical protein